MEKMMRTNNVNNQGGPGRLVANVGSTPLILPPGKPHTILPSLFDPEHGTFGARFTQNEVVCRFNLQTNVWNERNAFKQFLNNLSEAPNIQRKKPNNCHENIWKNDMIRQVICFFNACQTIEPEDRGRFNAILDQSTITFGGNITQIVLEQDEACINNEKCRQDRNEKCRQDRHWLETKIGWKNFRISMA